MRGPGPTGAALGSGLPAGVLAADCVYGLTVVADTTSPVYWTLVVALAVAPASLVAWRRLGTVRLLGLQVMIAAVVFLGASAVIAFLGSVTL